MRTISRIIFVLVFVLSLFQFCSAIDESNISADVPNAMVLSSAEKFFWIGIIFLIVFLIIALFVLFYRLKNFSQDRAISAKLSDASRAISEKSVLRARKLS